MGAAIEHGYKAIGVLIVALENKNIIYSHGVLLISRYLSLPRLVIKFGQAEIKNSPAAIQLAYK